MCQNFPSISPWNVWDLPFFMWEGFAREADAIRDQMNKQKG